MKILMLLENDYDKDERVKREVQTLFEAGFEIVVAAIVLSNTIPPEKRENCILYKKQISKFIYKTSVGALKFPFYFNFWRRYVSQILTEHRIDIIHIHDLPLSCIGNEVKKHSGTKLVIDLHENWPALIKTAVHTQTITGKLLSSNKQWVRYEKKMVKNADLVITVIEEARDRIVRLGVDKNKIAVVSNTIDIDNISIETKKKKDSVFTIFYGGAINRHRGLQIVFHAIRLLADNHIPVKFLIVGSGSYKPHLENLAKKLDIESSIVFTGQKSLQGMLEILSEADVAIIPHLRTENNDASSPNKLYQYMYLKKLVLSSDCTSLKRIISQTKSGLTYKCDAPGELASIIEKLNNDRTLLEEPGQNGRRAVIEKYNWNNDSKNLINGYNLLV